MDVGSFSSLEELIGSLLSRNGLPGLKSPPTLEEAHNPMGMASSTKSLKLQLLDNSVLHLFLKIRREGSEEEILFFTSPLAENVDSFVIFEDISVFFNVAWFHWG